MVERFDEEEIFSLVIAAVFFGFGVALISENKVSPHAVFGIGIVSAVLFGFAIGFFVKLVRKITD